jgi:site-specific DNA-methyltransferase (adenine-specific)
METKLIHGDCLLAMRQLPAESVDVVVTSPPYNLGINYGTYRDPAPRHEYLRWTVEWCHEVKRLLKPNGSDCHEPVFYLTKRSDTHSIV